MWGCVGGFLLTYKIKHQVLKDQLTSERIHEYQPLVDEDGGRNRLNINMSILC